VVELTRLTKWVLAPVGSQPTEVNSVVLFCTPTVTAVVRAPMGTIVP